ncbi:TraB/GumN family protein [Chitinophagaceae bacterium LB-8]|uniref:TraB/GumN family protein n=1 Tax=Paraflavisolibacter caeni TaxID=2982496 RepID=A0A9X2XYJ9_9BACT|nr:TraB/GumN family protein [Paraflavisolibacter caeni]MCU7551580.1 TraB/GumN family protein [Paraflavisolibacter caeni]
MKKTVLGLLFCLAGIFSFSQEIENTLLWRISGKSLSKPSYLFGTIHLLCSDDIQLSDSLKTAIQQSDKIYLELDMDNLFEVMSAMNKMKMRNDTTLSDLLTSTEYEKVKSYFKRNGSMIPFSMLETYKPMLTASTLMQSNMNCKAVAVEQMVMKEAKENRKEIKGLETMAYQLSIFDSIPYKFQAQQLLHFVENLDTSSESSAKEYEELAMAYKAQDLNKMEMLTGKDVMGFGNFTEVLLYNRNKNWVSKLAGLINNQSLVIAVGAGHLPGEKGLINLLRLAGYRVEPMENKMNRWKERTL